jgi:hypothetical protein
MRYVILVYSNPTFAAAWEKLTLAERSTFGRAHVDLTEALGESDELVVSEGLDDPSSAKRVAVRDGALVTTDGPFAEAKEHLAGFYLVECESVERVVEHAARLPDARFGMVEVRPVLRLAAAEW